MHINLDKDTARLYLTVCEQVVLGWGEILPFPCPPTQNHADHKEASVSVC